MPPLTLWAEWSFEAYQERWQEWGHQEVLKPEDLYQAARRAVLSAMRPLPLQMTQGDQDGRAEFFFITVSICRIPLRMNLH
ncbi:MAG: hypothetical protein ACLTW9_17400 [Enterocloster sp.]